MNGPLKTDTTIEEIVDNFSLLDDWQDRYGYLIELGRLLKPLGDDEMIDSNKVRGCVSQVWLVFRRDQQELHFRGASDAHIVSGLVAITLTLFSGKAPGDIIATDENEVFEQIGLSEHLTPQRSNGLRAMVQKIKSIASETAAPDS